ncbi:MAG: glutathione peroxidase [Bacteroidetes bacterium]|nr:glutathione peroxidase [Bacteroidota bacterium]
MKILMMLSMMLLTDPSTLYEFKPADINGKPFDISQYKGKKILVVNVASECGFTPQYEGLEQLYEKYKDRLMIIGFPANDFGQQEPGSNSEIQAFCKKNYGVTFQMMSKVSVKGSDIDPLFKWMTNLPNPDFTGDIKWNFEKFLFDENGNLVHRFRSKVEPMNDAVKNAIEGK